MNRLGLGTVIMQAEQQLHLQRSEGSMCASGSDRAQGRSLGLRPARVAGVR